MKILITGASGFLGQYILKELSKEKSVEKVYILTRSAHSNINYYDKRFCSVQGDITDLNLIASEELKEEITHIIHCAALYDLEAKDAQCLLHNVTGTQNVIWFAKTCTQLKEFHFASTIAVAGNFEGVFPENELPENIIHENAYARSKYLAEKLVREAKLNAKIKIWRFGILIGESETGHFSKIDGPYYLFKKIGQLYHQLKKLDKIGHLPIPYNRTTRVPFMAVDLAAKVMIHSLSEDKSTQKITCFHVVDKEYPFAQDFLDDTVSFFGLKLEVIPIIKNPFNKLILEAFSLPKELLSYFYSKCDYEISNIEKCFPNLKLPLYSSYKNRFFNKALETFLKEKN